MSKKAHILLTNDDGIAALGLQELWKSLQPFATISIVAPAEEQSGKGLGITCFEPLKVTKVLWEDQKTDAWSVSGTPADCVKMAVNQIVKEPIDMVVSGINKGTNSGRNALYSGTVGGAIEGSMQGIPSIAFSCYEYERPSYELALPYVAKIVQHFLKEPIGEGTLLNVNFPSNKHQRIKGIRIARQGMRFCKEKIQKSQEDENAYWLGLEENFYPEENAESDVSLLDEGYVAVAPLYINNLTQEHALEKIKKNFKL